MLDYAVICDSMPQKVCNRKTKYFGRSYLVTHIFRVFSHDYDVINSAWYNKITVYMSYNKLNTTPYSSWTKM